MTLFVDPHGTQAASGSNVAAADVVRDSDTANFAKDVLESPVPVIVDFWAPWCGPCKQLGPALEKVVKAAGGKVRMVKINVDENQDLAMQLRVQSIPAVYAFKDGRPVDAFVGAVPESQIKQFVERLVGDSVTSPLDEMLAQAAAALEAGDPAGALALYAQANQAEPGHPAAIAGTIRAHVAAGNPGPARQIAERLPADVATKPEVAAAISALDLAESTGEAAGDRAELAAKVAADPDDLQARFDLAMAHYGAGEREAAVDNLLEIIRRDKDWNEQAARKQLVKLFEAFGHSDPLTVAARKRLSSLLFS